MKTNFIFINDLHFGIADTERELKELREHFLPFLKENEIDVVFLGGDYFDHKLELGHPFSILALTFFREFIEICAEKNIAIRCIEGTQSHDRFQPRILENCIPDNLKIDYKYIETVGTENAFGMNILYVPEEYPLNIEEYYGEYKKGKYDLIVMHGTWDFIGFGGEEVNQNNDVNSCPIFIYNEWKDALEHGLAICGHIHGRHGFKTQNGDKIIYPGSFTAWSFDQISPRGFLYGTFDSDRPTVKTGRFTYKFINNPSSPTYANLDIRSLDLDLDNIDVSVLKDKIKEQADKVDYLKVNLDALSADKIMILKGVYSENKNIKIDNKPKKKKVEVKSSNYSQYAYILDDKLTVPETIQKYLKEEKNIDLDKTTIEDIIKAVK